ncbi:aldo/keto reductase [Granulicoccus phenolivorans]|uniref:aldo/keto reductase n=1 Tax=Granulicoccus phenolivorans TaxID=266854 RepID=UPI002480C66C|nr:aldo/keto reductase [Granulicoccus phenolivorans]
MSTLGLGTATFGVAPRESEAGALVDKALSAGINYIETANTYGNQARFDRTGLPGWRERRSAEEIVGDAIRGRRDEVVLATKVSEAIGDGPNDGGAVGGGLSRYHIMSQIERSLDRLGVDHVDIYYAHHPDPATAVEETVQAMADLVRQGMTRYYALSTYNGWQLAEVVAAADRLGVPRPICHQTRYSLAKRWIEAEVLPATRHFHLSVAAFSPLGGGLLAPSPADAAAPLGDARWGGPSFSDEEIATQIRFNELAAEWGIPSTHVALAWVLAQPGVVTAIVGPESCEQLTQLLPAAEITLTQEQLTALNEVCPGPKGLWNQ